MYQDSTDPYFILVIDDERALSAAPSMMAALRPYYTVVRATFPV